ncbi:MAG: apolipoprotein N-acyltransferase [Deltaproteobacteria bacterium]|nr:apolipoprotein N-acyltransferase [Deltaproteobacteria bacterium]
MKKRLAFAISSGFVIAAAHPPVDMWFLACVGLVPLFYALDGAGRRDAFLIGFASGFAFFLADVYWVVHSMYFYGGVPAWISVLVMAGLAAILALYWAAFSLFIIRVWRYSPVTKLLVIPSAWTAFEYLRGQLFTGFPWSLLGYTQTVNLRVIQIADITGVYGVTFLVVAVNAAIYVFIKSRAGAGEGRPALPALITGAVVVSALIYGELRIRQVDDGVGGWPELRVAAAQGSIDQSEKWNAAFRARTVDIYRELTARAASEGARLVVWPETAAPFILGEDAVESPRVMAAARENGIYVLTGSPGYTYNSENRQVSFYNSAWLINPLGEPSGRYDKVHLVPFGEYVPMRRFLPFVKKLTGGAGDFSAAEAPEPIRSELGGLGMLICYEAIFPEIAASEVRAGAELLVNITNDAWFGFTSAPYQHFGMSIMRAVENKSFLVRSANTGISAIVDPAGRVVGRTRLFEKTFLAGGVRMRRGPMTFYTRHGDAFAYGCMAIAALFMVAGLRKKI